MPSLQELIQSNLNNQGLEYIVGEEARDYSTPTRAMQGYGMSEADMGRDQRIANSLENPLVKLGWNPDASMVSGEINPRYRGVTYLSETFNQQARSGNLDDGMRAAGISRELDANPSKRPFMDEKMPVLLNKAYVGDGSNFDRTRIHETIHRGITKIRPYLRTFIGKGQEELVVRNLLRQLYPSKATESDYASVSKKYKKRAKGKGRAYNQKTIDKLTEVLYSTINDMTPEDRKRK